MLQLLFNCEKPTEISFMRGCVREYFLARCNGILKAFHYHEPDNHVWHNALKRDNCTWSQQDSSVFLDQAVTFNSVQNEPLQAYNQHDSISDNSNSIKNGASKGHCMRGDWNCDFFGTASLLRARTEHLFWCFFGIDEFFLLHKIQPYKQFAFCCFSKALGKIWKPLRPPS